MESSSVEVFRRRNEDYAKNTCSRGSTLRKNRVTTQVRLEHDGTPRLPSLEDLMRNGRN